MQMAIWRAKNGLSVRASGEIFGLEPGHTHRIEHGVVFPRPEIVLRIETVTRMIGPCAVTSGDHLVAWRAKHPQETTSERAAGRAAARAFLTAATKGKRNGKRKKGVRR